MGSSPPASPVDRPHVKGLIEHQNRGHGSLVTTTGVIKAHLRGPVRPELVLEPPQPGLLALTARHSTYHTSERRPRHGFDRQVVGRAVAGPLARA